MSIAELYGESFLELAHEEGIADIILSDLSDIAALFKKHPEYVKILDSPRIDKDELMKILNDDFFGKINHYTLNFLKLLCEKHIVHHLAECLEAYEDLYNKYNNIKTVNITTARPLGEDIVKRLVEKLEARTGGKIAVKKRIDESCIGGIIIEMDGKRIDASVKSELLNIRQALIN